MATCPICSTPLSTKTVLRVFVETGRGVKLKKAKDRLKVKQRKRAGPSFDPNDLPNKALKPNRSHKPKESREAYRRAGELFSGFGTIRDLKQAN